MVHPHGPEPWQAGGEEWKGGGSMCPLAASPIPHSTPNPILTEHGTLCPLSIEDPSGVGLDGY